MGLKNYFLGLLLFMSFSLLGQDATMEDIKPKRTMAVLFTPIVIPDLISAKAAFEYRLHKNFNLVVPLEFKMMNYRTFFNVLLGEDNAVAKLNKEGEPIRLLWSFDLKQVKISTGVGVKWIPFTSSMASGFFVKSTMLGGYERLEDSRDKSNGVVFTHVISVGYTWVMKDRFTLGIEGGEEYTWHLNAIQGLPGLLLDGFMPIAQFSLGFTF